MILCHQSTHPISGINALAVMGRTVPPIDDPAAYRPRASPRRRINHCDSIAVTGPVNIPAVICELLSSLVVKNYNNTYPSQNSLAQEKLPIGTTLRNQESGGDKDQASRCEHATKITHVQKPCEYQRRNIQAGLLAKFGNKQAS